VHHYLIFDATTSLGWDTGRAVTNFVCIMLAGSAMLATFRRAARRAAFEAPVLFEGRVSAERGPEAPAAEARVVGSSSSDDG
jgi:energy-coupling factor transport system substrate-specific component